MARIPPPNSEVVSPLRFEVARGNGLTPEIRMGWRSVDEGIERPESPYQGLEFFEHMEAIVPAESLGLATLWDDPETLVGAIPLRVGRFPLTYHIRTCILWEVGLRGVEIIGGSPCIPEDPRLYDLLFQALDEEFPACDLIALSNIAKGGPLWEHLKQSTYINNTFFFYAWRGVNLYHTVELPRTFDGYLSRYRPRYRRNIKRQIRILRDAGGGRPVLRKITSGDEVADLLKFSASLDSKCSYLKALQQRRAELASLAGRGFLLAYLVSYGGTPCAMTIGVKYKNTYSVERIVRNRAFDRFSPGTTILQMVIEDLIASEPVDLVDLGIGWPRYSYSSTNTTRPCASVYLLRKTLSNRLLRISHDAFRSVKRWTRQVLP